MYQRGESFYADFYDGQGKRVRQSFPSAAAAAKYERQGKTVAKKQKAAGLQSPRYCGPKPTAEKASRTTQPRGTSRAKSSKSRATNSRKR